jgi:hypothetical protein
MTDTREDRRNLCTKSSATLVLDPGPQFLNDGNDRNHDFDDQVLKATTINKNDM